MIGKRDVTGMVIPSDIECHLSYLHGFLKALEIVSSREVRVGVNIYANSGDLKLDLEKFLVNCEVGFSDISFSTIDWSGYKDQFFKLIYNGFNGLSANVVKDIDWNLDECYLLLSASMSVSGTFDNIYAVKINEKQDEFVFIMEFQNFCIINFIEISNSIK